MPTIQGKIIQSFEPRSGKSDRGEWMVQDFLLESYDQPYPRKCVFTVWGADRLQQFNIKQGDDLAVDIDIDAREYNGRFYNSVRAWRVTRIAPPQLQPTMPQPPMGATMGMSAPVADASQPTSGVSTTSTGAVAATLDPLGGDPTEDLPF